MSDTPAEPTSTGSNRQPESPLWERQTLEKVLLASVEEQRRARRWGIFFKSLLALYLGVGAAFFGFRLCSEKRFPCGPACSAQAEKRTKWRRRL